VVRCILVLCDVWGGRGGGRGGRKGEFVFLEEEGVYHGFCRIFFETSLIKRSWLYAVSPPLSPFFRYTRRASFPKRES
jgi:hypothetical protein